MRKFATTKNTTTMKIKKDYELQRVCDEALLIPIDSEDGAERETISLDPVSEYLWEKVATMESFTVETLVTLLMAEYDVDEETAREDCALIAEAWQEMGIVGD
jgi:hypothetical protein